MSQSPAASELRPATDYIAVSPQGEPYIEGYKCGSCGAVFLGPRTVCSKCSTRGQMKAIPLAKTGKLYAFSVVYRSFPGIKTPFVSAVVDLDGGGTIKGNLIDVEPDPQTIKMGMPVEITFGDAGRTDKAGNHYLAYFIKPSKNSAK